MVTEPTNRSDASGRADLAERPNILVIMSDQHHARVMGCAGDPVVATPALDSLAATGARLTNLYCHAPLCAPSRMSFMTGMLPSTNGVLTNEQLYPSQHPTFAHSAGAAGYRPELIGKMHALGVDQHFGFTDRRIGDHGPNFAGSRTTQGHPDVRGDLPGAAGPGLPSLVRSGRGHHAYFTRDALVTEATVARIREHDIERRSGGRPAPFFLTMGLLLPHQPYVAPADLFDRYEGRVPPPKHPAADHDADRHPFLAWWRTATGLDHGPEPVTEEMVQRSRTAYWAMVHRMDELIGRVLGTLDELGYRENTLVIYTSDHGDHLGERGLWWKQTLLDPAVKVPGLISWPGVVPAGVVSDRVCGLVDLTQTIVAAAGGPALPAAVGRDLVPYLNGQGADDPGEVIAEHCADIDQPNGLGPARVDRPYYQRMVRRGPWKYVDHDDLPHQLFNLDNDPDELTNLVDEPGLSEVVAGLAARARDGWDPEQVRGATRTSVAETRVLADWATATGYRDRHRWSMKPEYNVLGDPPGAC